MVKRLIRKGFGYHLTAYLAVGAVLLWINHDISPHYLWAKWPIAGWGIGLAFHGLSVVLSTRKVEKGLLYHLAAYIIINAFLIFVNLNVSPEYLWFKFPLTAWTVVIVFHLYRGFSAKNG